MKQGHYHSFCSALLLPTFQRTLKCAKEEVKKKKRMNGHHLRLRSVNCIKYSASNRSREQQLIQFLFELYGQR